MRASTRVLLGAVTMVASVLTISVLFHPARQSFADIIGPTVIVDSPSEVRTAIVLDDPQDVLAVAKSRVAHPLHRRFTPVVGECVPEAMTNSVNLGHVRLIRPDPRDPVVGGDDLDRFLNSREGAEVFKDLRRGVVEIVDQPTRD